MWLIVGSSNSPKADHFLVPKFVSTMTVPPFPVEASGGTSYHALWPGLQPTSDDFVYQNVVDDWYPSQTNTRWDVSTWYGSYDTA